MSAYSSSILPYFRTRSGSAATHFMNSFSKACLRATPFILLRLWISPIDFFQPLARPNDLPEYFSLTSGSFAMACSMIDIFLPRMSTIFG